MLRVRIEMCPLGDEKRAREIGRMYIANVGGDVDRGDYRVAVCRRGSDAVPQEIYGTDGWSDDAKKRIPKAARAGKVENYPRLAYNVWRLIARAVLAAFPEEAKRAKRDERTLLDEQVMRGLQLMAACSGGPLPDADHIAIGKALEWIAQGAG